MSPLPLKSHDIQLASFDGERAVLLAVGAAIGGWLRGGLARLGRALALMPGPQSVR